MLHPLTGQPIDSNEGHNEDHIDQTKDELTGARSGVSDLLMAIGNGLFLVFLAFAVVDSLPFAVMNTKWQLGLVLRLLNLGLVPLVGFACVHLASILNPANRFYQARLVTVRRLAMIAAIGYLLLIPLQGFGTWRSYKDMKSFHRSEYQRVLKQMDPVKKAIASATSTKDLQKKLSRPIGNVNFTLSDEDLKEPLELVKKAMLEGVATSEIKYRDRLSAPMPQQTWAVTQAGARTLFASLGYFIAFAAGAQPGRSSLTLSDLLSSRFQSLFGRRPRRSRHSL